MRLLLGGIIVSLGLWTLPVQAQQVTSTQVGAMVEALRLAAPKTGKTSDGLYSEWQITPGIIPSWSKQCIGRELTPQELEASPAKAREVVSCITRRELQKQYAASNNNETTAVRRTACWWMTGSASGCSSGSTATYVQRVLDFYQQQSAKKPQRQVSTSSNYRPQTLKK
ncbi:hypothetical protein [Gloeocapsopsis dulcis]|uniref:Transglycosylase SLT domain-containing protein n=1 Tax=Gloeocapsopsis dulcis AAB1 = 1H9 TaxID=1433147 RepID=A0A6N8G3T4_9CHRO|nr:hypothetical protein [Gloeocapsopsis dulcis]MUL38867.1 hypothetical protein [Gloeocapsopsis dulcis AAB1 = 1H9]WNN89298.1 hypothetical protein P0S91_24190 [Gloeocapsopsis dulcis]